MNLTGNFDKFNQGKRDEETPDENIENYNSAGNVRNICFVELSGNRTFLNYAYLISGSLKDNTIILTFTTHVITIEGVNLEKLFIELMRSIPRTILVKDMRYASLIDSKEIIVTHITFNIGE